MLKPLTKGTDCIVFGRGAQKCSLVYCPDFNKRDENEGENLQLAQCDVQWSRNSGAFLAWSQSVPNLEFRSGPGITRSRESFKHTNRLAKTHHHLVALSKFGYGVLNVVDPCPKARDLRRARLRCLAS